ncbi:helix-turn-helix domain-containing protein, partial [Kineococcus glutinatus]|uniref:helix-turn-helix domain-containing protein n=1 Tax=Kineococcus glutinatus TaxID=1070872 RepID=UPI0031EB6194
MEDVRIGLLGPLEVLRDGRPLPVPGARLAALLARLALDAGRVVTVPELEAAVWPDGTAGGAGALQSLVSRLRRA